MRFCVVGLFLIAVAYRDATAFDIVGWLYAILYALYWIVPLAKSCANCSCCGVNSEDGRDAVSLIFCAFRGIVLLVGLVDLWLFYDFLVDEVIRSLLVMRHHV
jgi:hypothetical protein